MIKNTLEFVGNAIERTMESGRSKLDLPSIHFFGNLSEEQLHNAVEEIGRVEDIYFALNEKLRIKELQRVIATQQKPSVTTSSDAATPPQRSVAKQHNEEKPQEDNTASKSRELEKRYQNAAKITLREVGHSTSGVYLGAGARFIPKCKEKRFVVYLQQGNSVVFLLGTQLQDCVAEQNPVAGDYITITKTVNYRKAHDRSHAQAAQFVLEILEQAPSDYQDEEVA